MDLATLKALAGVVMILGVCGGALALVVGARSGIATGANAGWRWVGAALIGAAAIALSGQLIVFAYSRF